MAKLIATAQELRQRADEEERHWNDHLTAAMLRQAADALEREEEKKKKKKKKKKYEYTLKYCAKDGSCEVSEFHSDTQDEAERYSDTFNGETFVVLRRSVGEWEEVK